MNHEDARRLLERIRVVRHACDLDLLIFFARHPRSLLASESLVGFLGYDLKEIAESLDVLLAAGVLTRTQTPAHAARLYVLAIDDTDDGGARGWLPELVALASTREGRLVLMEALATQRGKRGGPAATTRSQERATLGPRWIVASRNHGRPQGR